MYLPELNRELIVCSRPELDQHLRAAPDLWLVVSIRDPGSPSPKALAWARSVHETIFEDLRSNDRRTAGLPVTRDHLRGIFNFVQAHPAGPLIVHCLAGVSRSPAVALVLILHRLLCAEPPLAVSGFEQAMARALDRALQLRPGAKPNPLVVRKGLEAVFPGGTARALMDQFERSPLL